MALEEVGRRANMAKYIITENVRTVNTYTLELDDKLIQRLNADIQEGYVSEQQGQTIPYIDLDTLMDIIKSYGDLDAMNINRIINHKTPFEDCKIKNRNIPDMPSCSLYELVLDMINDYAWESAHVEELDSYDNEWYAELKDEEED